MLTPEAIASLPIEEYAFPGALRDALVAAILAGQKTSTTSLLSDYTSHGEPLPVVGDRGVVIDSLENPVCVTEVTEVRILPLREVDLPHAIDEGEGFETVSEWRTAHERFWHSADFRQWTGDPSFSVTDATDAVLVRFRVTTRL